MNASGDAASGYQRTVHGHGGLSTGAIVGIAVGCAIAFAVAVGIVCCHCKRKRRRRAAREQEMAARIAREEMAHGHGRERQEHTGIVIDQGGVGSDGRDEGQSSREAEGLDRSGAVTHGDDYGGCPMCRSAFGIDAGDLPTRLDCGHLFHGQCIRPWVKVNKSCPVCNSDQITFLGLGNVPGSGTELQQRLAQRRREQEQSFSRRGSQHEQAFSPAEHF
ncbi:hypothetical protein EJB05_49292, partial [Eragrostis curvula]